MIEFKCIHEAGNLPSEWDIQAGNYFQQKPFLTHTECYNPCHQRYYVCYEDGKPAAFAIVYSLSIDILTFLNVKSPLRMHIVGIPCSVSAKGIFGTTATVAALKKHLLKVEKGLLLILNLDKKPEDESCAYGTTLPTIAIHNRFGNWQDYLISLRSNYRRRIKQISQGSEDLQWKRVQNSSFTEEMYRQYLDVYKRSKGKLELLTIDFFKHLPSDFVLTVCFRYNRVIGWNIALHKQSTWYFFLGGIDYKLNKTYHTYLRLLSNLVKDGIEQKCNIIELGQTAEIPKMRMGGKPVPLYMEAHHSNPIFNYFLKFFSKLLEYKRKLENPHPLKEEIA